MQNFNKQALVDQFQQMKADKVPIIGGGAGTGLSAKCEEAGGIDLIVIYNSCLLYTSPSPRDRQKSRMPSSA